MVTFPSSGSSVGFFWYSLWEPSRAPVGKTKVWGRVSSDCFLPEFLILRFVHTEPPAIHQLQLRFSNVRAGFHGGFCSWISAQTNYSSLYLLVLPIWRAVVCPMTSLFWGTRGAVDFFSLFNILLVFRWTATSRLPISYIGNQKSPIVFNFSQWESKEIGVLFSRRSKKMFWVLLSVLKIVEPESESR